MCTSNYQLDVHPPPSLLATQLRRWSSQGLHRHHCTNTRQELTPRTMSSKMGRIEKGEKPSPGTPVPLPAINQFTNGNLVRNNSTSWLFKRITLHLTGFEGAQRPIFCQASCRWNECSTPGSTKQWHFIGTTYAWLDIEAYGSWVSPKGRVPWGTQQAYIVHWLGC